jgi:hypothetical protein
MSLTVGVIPVCKSTSPNPVLQNSLLKYANSQISIPASRFVTGAVVTNSSGTLTLSAAQMAANSIFQETGTTPATFTLDTGANLSAAIPGVAVGETIDFVVSNASNQTITMSGASGTVLANVMTVPTLTTRIFFANCTGTNTWVIY